MREQLHARRLAEAVVDDAVLILSELLSNACRHGRPLGDHPAGEGEIRAAWQVDAAGRLTVEVTDGGGPTRPAPATPSVTAHGGRGLHIISALADDWGVRDEARGEVTVWVTVTGGDPATRHRREDFAARTVSVVGGRGLTDFEDLEDIDGAQRAEKVREFGDVRKAGEYGGAGARGVPRARGAGRGRWPGTG